MYNTAKILGLIAILAFGSLAYAQDAIGGPYTADGSDVVLLHFEDNLTNDGTAGNAVATGTVSYVASMTGFGQAIYLNNAAVFNTADTTWGIADTAYLTIPWEAGIDLTGDITVEGWFKFADTTSGYALNDSTFIGVPSSNPYLVSKPDSSGGNQTYMVQANLDGTLFTSYDVENGTFHLPDPNASASTDGALAEKWYHFTYQRDATNRVVTMAIHDEAGNLIDFNYGTAHPAFTTPVSAALALVVGARDSDGNDLFHGYLDEIKVSSSIEYYDLPPVITYNSNYSSWGLHGFGRQSDDEMAKVSNQPDDATSYPFDLNIYVLGSAAGVSSANVMWRLADQDERVKVAKDDVSFTAATLTGAGINFTGSISQQALGSSIAHYVTATSTGGTTEYYLVGDSTYDRFAVVKENDIVLQLNFEQDNAVWVDSSRYGHTIEMFGQHAIYDGVDQVGGGMFAGQFIAGNFAKMEIHSGILAPEEYTITVWVKQDSVTGDTRFINYGPPLTGYWFMPTYTLYMKTNGNIGNDVVNRSRYPTEWPWHFDRNNVLIGPDGEWSHYLTSVGPDSIVMIRADEADAIIEWSIQKGEEEVGNAWVAGFHPVRPPNGFLSIAQIGGNPDLDAFYIGLFDNLTIYNYQTVPITFGDGVLKVEPADLPRKYSLSQNFPNPFNPTTTINFEVGVAENVRLEVYDLLGRLVKTLVSRDMQAGVYTVTWDGSNTFGKATASGVYFYRIVTPSFVKSRKMILLR